jgi:uncharacterized protein YhfF
MKSAVLEFWRNYLDSLPPDLDQEPKPFGVFSFEDSKKLADELAALVRQGIKTATCSALMDCEKDQIPLPKKGDLSIVLDGDGNTVLVIETVSVVVLPFNEVSEQFAFEEGEGADRWRIGETLTRTTFAIITSRIERSTRRCRLFANGSSRPHKAMRPPELRQGSGREKDLLKSSALVADANSQLPFLGAN